MRSSMGIPFLVNESVDQIKKGTVAASDKKRVVADSTETWPRAEQADQGTLAAGGGSGLLGPIPRWTLGSV